MVELGITGMMYTNCGTFVLRYRALAKRLNDIAVILSTFKEGTKRYSDAESELWKVQKELDKLEKEWSKENDSRNI
jgi:hypothetical protein